VWPLELLGQKMSSSIIGSTVTLLGAGISSKRQKSSDFQERLLIASQLHACRCDRLWALHISEDAFGISLPPGVLPPPSSCPLNWWPSLPYLPPLAP
jgi:hypothetical protein